MCEVFGLCSQDEREINRYLKEFYSHSGSHPHGWGLACLNGREAMIEKEPIQATRSNYLKERLSVPVTARNALAHIRYATIGNVEYRNCHPYTRKDSRKRRWTFVHNGTIFRYPALDPYLRLQQGDTDSERILLYLIDRMDQADREKGQPLRAEERFALFDSIFVDMAEGNKLNTLFYDGEYFYVHTNYANSMYYLQTGRSVIFSTQALDGGDWQPVPFTRLLVFRDGRQVFEGTNHGYQYVDREEDLKFLYQAFAEL